MGGVIIGSSCGRRDDSDLLIPLMELAIRAIGIILLVLFIGIGYLLLG